ncbi:hypothetical protein LTV02_30085 [Nocardia yamanashiensis]|uniref:hypothetical protein n=1 Tax=Nocardia yamanashiensis TaxID=209247 RepID=UPI001E2D28B2|nr:hypothetical protein [Nocardia yamanashiensis]UGT40249.1 hypothetical protein LTV02_30085 [Nocardia yamanashiensis]
MSYDHVLLPSGAAATPAEVDAYLTTQDGKPAVEAIAGFAAELDRRNGELDEIDAFLGAPAVDGAMGEVLFVSSPYDAIGHLRGVLFELATPRGYAVYDPQLAWLIDPAGAVPLTVNHGGAGEFPYLTKELVELWVPELGAPGPYLIAERADQDYIQTYRHEDGRYDLEYRAGAPDKHFAIALGDAKSVSELIWEWATGERERFDSLDWQRLTF